MTVPPDGAARMLATPRNRSAIQPFHQFGHLKGTKDTVNAERAAKMIDRANGYWFR